MRRARWLTSSATLLVFWFYFNPVFAATISVPLDYSTIQAAIVAALPGDSVAVAPGNYVDNLDFLGKRITVYSVYGAEFTHIRPLVKSVHTVKLEGASTQGAEFSGFSVHGGNPEKQIIMCSNHSQSTVRDNIISGNGGWNPCIEVYSDDVEIINNLIAFNQTRPAVRCILGSATVIDNTIYANAGGIEFSGSTGTVLNNIVARNEGHGLAGQPGNVEYNTFWDNQDDFECDGCYPNNLTGSPQFLGGNSGEFMLRLESPAIDAGHPDPTYNDPDGTRNDMGARPKVPAGMIPWNIRVGTHDRYHVTESVPTIAWLRNPSANPPFQDGFEIQIGSDLDWSVAELWATGVLLGSSSTIPYTGPELVDGSSHYLRMRLSAGGNWGEWRTVDFRPNQIPTAPTRVSPVAGDSVSAHPLELAVTNATDADGDSLTYEYRIYQDDALSVEVAVREYISETDGQTSSGVFIPLSTSSEYWWRARASDGYESGPWSDSAHFLTQPAVVRFVPIDYATIQSAIDSAHYLDTISVAPGSYLVRLDFKGRRVVVMGAGGPSETHLYPLNENDIMMYFGTGENAQTQLTGFTIHGSAKQIIMIEPGSSPSIEYNIFRDYGGMGWEPAVIASWGDRPTVRGNLFIGNQGIACVGIYLGDVLIERNTFIGNHRGIFSLTGQGTAINNQIIQNDEYGISGRFAEQHHNNVWGNNPNYADLAAPHPTNQFADPWFCDPVNENFALSAISPSAAAGSDGGPIGAFGLSCPFPLYCQCNCHADPECDSVVDVLDVVRTIDRAFNAASESNDASCILYGPVADGRTDVNCDGHTDVVDVVTVVAVALRGAPAESRFCSLCSE